MRAATYVRVSTDEQVREGVSLDMQEQRCQDAALAAGAARVEVFRDEGYTGTNMQRPALQRLLGALGDYDVVYVWKLSRLSRNLRQLLDILAQLDEADVGLVSVTENFDLASPWGKAALHMLATFNELQVDVIRENVRSALDSIARSGQWRGGSIFGYEPGEEKETIQPHPGEAEEVRRIFRLFNQGRSLAAIVRDLNRRDVPCKDTGRQWYSRTVRGILRNPTYIGKVRWHDEILAGNHKPLIRRSTFEQAQERLATHQRYGAGTAIRSLTPIMTCGICGSDVTINTSSSYRYIVCRARRDQARANRHDAICTSYPKAAAAIWRHTELLFADGDLDQAIALHQQQQARIPELQEFRSRIAEIDQALELNLEAAHRGALTLDLLERHNAPLVTERQQLTTRLHKQAEQTVGTTEMEGLVGVDIGDLLGQLRQCGAVDQLTFLGKLYDRIDLHQNRLVFHHKYGLMPPGERILPKYYAPRRGITEVGF